MEVPKIACLHVCALPVVLGKLSAAAHGIARADPAVIRVFGVVEIPCALIKRDLFSSRDVSPRNQSRLAREPGVRVARMIEILVQAVVSVRVTQCEIKATPYRPHGRLAVVAQHVGRHEFTAEIHHELADPDGHRGKNAVAVDPRLPVPELGTNPSSLQVRDHHRSRTHSLMRDTPSRSRFGPARSPSDAARWVSGLTP